MKQFLLRWVINTLAVAVAVYVMPGIQYQKPLDLLIASLLLGIFNAFLRPVLMFLALPLLIFSLGLFTLVINALVLYFIGFLLRPHFYVDSFWAAFWGALIISLVAMFLGILTGTNRSRITVSRHHGRGDRGPGPGGSGPVIDV